MLIFLLCTHYFTLLSSAIFMLWAIEVAQRYQEQTRLNVSNCTRLKFGSDLTFAIVNFNISTYSMFALYPRSWYCSGAALEVRSVALLHTFYAAELSYFLCSQLVPVRCTQFGCKGTTFF